MHRMAEFAIGAISIHFRDKCLLIIKAIDSLFTTAQARPVAKFWWLTGHALTFGDLLVSQFFKWWTGWVARLCHNINQSIYRPRCTPGLGSWSEPDNQFAECAWLLAHEPETSLISIFMMITRWRAGLGRTSRFSRFKFLSSEIVTNNHHVASPMNPSGRGRSGRSQQQVLFVVSASAPSPT